MCLKAILKYTEFGILILSRRTFLSFSQQCQKDTNHARDVVNLKTDVGGRVTGLEKAVGSLLRDVLHLKINEHCLKK